MSKLRLTAAAAILALTITTFGAAQPTAAAAPPVPNATGTAPSLSEKGHHVAAKGKASKLSAKRLRKADVIITLLRRAKGKHGHYDYRKMDKYDKKHSTWRREAAATVLWLKKPVDHMSKAERAKVKHYIPKRSYAKVKFDNAKKQKGAPRGGRNKVCTGWTGYLTSQSIEVPITGLVKSWFFLNSCHSNALQFVVGVEALAISLVGVIFPPTAPILEPVAFLYGVGALYIQLCQNNSKYNAIFITQDFDRLRMLSQ